MPREQGLGAAWDLPTNNELLLTREFVFELRPAAERPEARAVLKSRLAEPGNNASALCCCPQRPLHCYCCTTCGMLKAKKVQLFNMAASDMPADMTKSLPCILSCGPRVPKSSGEDLRSRPRPSRKLRRNFQGVAESLQDKGSRDPLKLFLCSWQKCRSFARRLQRPCSDFLRIARPELALFELKGSSQKEGQRRRESERQIERASKQASKQRQPIR